MSLKKSFNPLSILLLCAACAAAGVRTAPSQAGSISPQARAWTQYLTSFTWDIGVPYDTPSLRYVISQALVFPMTGAGAADHIAKIRDGDTPSVTAPLIAAQARQNLAPYAENVKRQVLEKLRSDDAQAYVELAPEILGLNELMSRESKLEFPEDLRVFFGRAAKAIRTLSSRKASYDPDVPIKTLLERIDDLPAARHLIKRLRSSEERGALMLAEMDGDAVVLTGAGSRYARRTKALHDPAPIARYNGFMKTSSWVENWVVPAVDGDIEGKIGRKARIEDIEERLKTLIERDPWGGLRRWNPVSGSNGSDLVHAEPRVFAPGAFARGGKLAGAAIAAGSVLQLLIAQTAPNQPMLGFFGGLLVLSAAALAAFFWKRR